MMFVQKPLDYNMGGWIGTARIPAMSATVIFFMMVIAYVHIYIYNNNNNDNNNNNNDNNDNNNNNNSNNIYIVYNMYII